ncbi:Piso0_004842 [Millerozyma farinosa CBS 7064]|uniref:Piso0_004842 protein n=1 Tax=Pichia sorbitophila (strain ATCC MYA-4447 / BCRC 22081 / CBS 7064 / NBRC 10061 / NRRL Y-12695) TaxID=559304 RepID=G8Y3J2_PICSO|nr:Piso0_004842 [Millerozyma farinosa CBS 7064]
MTSDPQGKVTEDYIRSNTSFSESRLRSLYGGFANLKQLNPEGYEANIQAWRSLIQDLIKHKVIDDSVLSLSVNAATSQLLSISTYGEPKSLTLILGELVNSGVLVPLSLFEQDPFSYISQDNAGWLFTNQLNFKKLLTWGVQALGFKSTFRVLDKSGKLKHERYISISSLLSLGSKIRQKLADVIQKGSYTELLFNRRLFGEFLRKLEPAISPIDVDILLTYLKTYTTLLKTSVIEGKEYIKLGSGHGQFEINDVDISIIDLMANIGPLKNRITFLSNKISDIENLIRKSVHIKSSSNDSIKSLLRVKKAFIKSLEHSSTNMSHLETTLLKIDEATYNKDIYRILESSSSILSSLNSEISIDKINDIKDSLTSDMKLTDEISDALMINDNKDDDVLIERELDELYEVENSGTSVTVDDQTENEQPNNENADKVETDNKEASDQQTITDEARKEALFNDLQKLSINDKDDIVQNDNTKTKVPLTNED